MSDIEKEKWVRGDVGEAPYACESSIGSTSLQAILPALQSSVSNNALFCDITRCVNIHFAQIYFFHKYTHRTNIKAHMSTSQTYNYADRHTL